MWRAVLEERSNEVAIIKSDGIKFSRGRINNRALDFDLGRQLSAAGSRISDGLDADFPFNCGCRWGRAAQLSCGADGQYAVYVEAVQVDIPSTIRIFRG